jgi:hypothetical protein
VVEGLTQVCTKHVPKEPLSLADLSQADSLHLDPGHGSHHLSLQALQTPRFLEEAKAEFVQRD